MKKVKLITMMLLMMLTTISFGQSDSVYLIKDVDDMTDKTYIYPSTNFIVANETKTIGFTVDCYINQKGEFGFLTVTMVNIGSCNEGDEIIILFENGGKITKKSWNDFNCEGNAYFYLTKDEIELLRTNPLSKIRMINGRTYDSFTGEVQKKDKRYFIQIFYALDNNLFSEP
jgi:uncharacterized protein YlzI (FlbEa/FlbD family)